MQKIAFVFFDAGGGHRSAAVALKTVIEHQGRPWHVDLVNLQETLDEIDVFRKFTRIRMQDLYNMMLAKGLTLGSEYLMPAMHGVIRIYQRKQVQMLTAFWQHHRPDLLVSVIPNFNRALYESIKAANPSVPFVTILTDFADFPPHFWIERQDQYFICGTEEAARQARDMAADPGKVLLVSGMILRPSFYTVFEHDRETELRRLGLDPQRPTGLILFGGHGSPVMLKIVRRLQTASRDLQLIAICGKNEKLTRRLRELPGRLPLHVVGFTSEVPYYMSLSDFFVGKPGPGSISEAIRMKLPVIIERNAWTLPQERYNADWVLEKGVGLVLPSFSRIAEAVDRLLEPQALGSYRANVASICNRAVFEIPDILDMILKRQ
jgi:1,2-diacylglycerol 3-beta-galactosyltransferase